MLRLTAFAARRRFDGHPRVLRARIGGGATARYFENAPIFYRVVDADFNRRLLSLMLAHLNSGSSRGRHRRC